MPLSQTPLFEDALRRAADLGASDIHLVSGEPPVYRVRGELQRADTPVFTDSDLEALALAALGPQELATLGPQRGDATTSCGLPGILDGQLLLARSLGSLIACVRILPSLVLSAAEVGAPQAMIDAVEQPNGIVVVGGVTGSGKSTTAMALIEHLNTTRPVHIGTAEDPIAARFTAKIGLIQQREVGVDVPDTLSAMRTALKQDLDVFYLSILSSAAELEGLVTLAEAGLLTVVAVHGNSPEDLIQRCLDVFPDEGKAQWVRRFAAVLRAVSVQRLVRRASGRGRVAAYGYLTVDAATRHAMQHGNVATPRDTPPAASAPLSADLDRLVAQGEITREAADRCLAEG